MSEPERLLGLECIGRKFHFSAPFTTGKLQNHGRHARNVGKISGEVVGQIFDQGFGQGLGGSENQCAVLQGHNIHCYSPVG